MDTAEKLRELTNQLDQVMNQLGDIDTRKAEKKDMHDLKQKALLDVRDKMTSKDDLHRLFNDFISEQNKKSFSLRRELFEKVSELQRDIQSSVA